jgi:hypothetical protein
MPLYGLLLTTVYVVAGNVAKQAAKIELPQDSLIWETTKLQSLEHAPKDALKLGISELLSVPYIITSSPSLGRARIAV